MSGALRVLVPNDHPRRRTLTTARWTAAGGAGLLALAALSALVSRIGAVPVVVVGALLLVTGAAALGLALTLPARATRALRSPLAIPIGCAILVLVMAGSQFLVPLLMQQRMRSRLGSIGEVAKLDIGATPAVKMLWGDVDRAEVHLRELDSQRRGGRGVQGDMLATIAGMDSLKLTVDHLNAGPITAENVKVSKEGPLVRVHLAVDPAAIGTMLTGGAGGIEVKPKVTDGELTLKLSGDQLGGQKIDLRVFAQDGQIMSQMQVDKATAQMMGLPPGTEPPAQPMFGNESVTIETLKARTEGEQVVLDGIATVA
jgi:hypothetical protein